ncbi:MAG: sulfatase-like hydrolase/transferase [Candidatus Brocadiia bacterium]|nr:sulfatase-like hydrolase/transferase [Candidatus Brocadiia bacterium]
MGMLLRKLKDCGIYGDTPFIFTTDHGMYIGEHDRVGKSHINPDDDRGAWPLYGEITHIPLMVKAPRCKGGVRRTEFVQPPDICPTILEAAGVEVSADMMGRSLMPLLSGEATAPWDRKCAVSASGPLRTGSSVTVTDGA